MYPYVAKYTDFDGVNREETVYFNLTEAEIAEMELGTAGGFSAMLEKMIKSPDVVSFSKIYRDMILKSYGEKSADGRFFRKLDKDGRPLSIDFSQSKVYSIIYMDLIKNDEAAYAFLKGIAPVNITDEQIRQAAERYKTT